MIPEEKVFSKRRAYLDLLNLCVCSKTRSEKINGHVIYTRPNQKALSLRALAKRWNWRTRSGDQFDAKKVQRFLKWCETREILKVEKHKGANLNLIECATHFATPNATQRQNNSTPIATPNTTDNQPVIKPSDTPIATDEDKKGRGIATPNATNYIMYYYDYKGYNYSSSTPMRAGAYIINFPYEKQIYSLLNFFNSELGQNSLKTESDKRKIGVPPTTKHLVEEVERWAMSKYSRQPLVLKSFKDEFQCWGDFCRYWLPRIPKGWEKVQEMPRNEARGKGTPPRKGKKVEKPNNRIFKKEDYTEGLAHNAELARRMQAKKAAKKAV